MRKFILSSVLVMLFAVLAQAQSGYGGLKGYVKCGRIGNDGCQFVGAKVVLHPIENWVKSTEDFVTETDESGHYEFEVSFGEYLLMISANGYKTYQTTVYIPSSSFLKWGTILHKSESAITNKFDGTWAFEGTRSGLHVGLSVTIKQNGGRLTGDYGSYSSKESNGKILSSRIAGNTAYLEIDNDWGGLGTVKITRLKGNRLHWQIIKRKASKGEFIVLQDEILQKL